MKERVKYIVLIVVTVLTGIASRQIDGIPLFIGDTLYATMIFFMVKFIWTKGKALKIAVISLLVTFAIEFSQLYKAAWISNIRSTLLGRLVLGQGFLYSDLFAYVLGVLLAIIVVVLIGKNRVE